MKNNCPAKKKIEGRCKFRSVKQKSKSMKVKFAKPTHEQKNNFLDELMDDPLSYVESSDEAMSD